MYFTGPARQYRSPAALFGIQLPVVALTVLVVAWEVSGEECVDTPHPRNWTSKAAGLPINKSAFHFFSPPALIISCLYVRLEACVTPEVVALVEEPW